MEIGAALCGGVGVSALEWKLASTTLNTNAVKIATVAAFGVNFFSVQLPGRLDGAEAVKRSGKTGKTTGARNSGRKAREAIFTRSYISPAGWAFFIWAPIYLGEIIFSLIVVFLQFDGPVGHTVKAFLPYWVSANLFQSLWCYAFRPIFHTEPAKQVLGPFVSALFLGLTALSLGRVHVAMSQKSSSCTFLKRAIFVPLTMHFGWLTAATLVNINGALANYSDAGMDANLFRLGCASVVTALAACVFFAVKTKDPTYPFVIGWALLAVSDGLVARIENSSNEAIAANATCIRVLSNMAGVASIVIGLALIVLAISSAAWPLNARMGQAEKNRNATGEEAKNTNCFLIEDGSTLENGSNVRRIDPKPSCFAGVYSCFQSWRA